jgi:hypothetical protein
MATKEEYASKLTVEKMFNSVDTLDWSSCWLWNGTVNKDGYGIIAKNVDKQRYSLFVHRVSWYYVKGPIADGLVIDHLCHNPKTCINGYKCEHRRCYNPYHLEAVTREENNIRGASVNSQTGLCKNGIHKWVEENIRIQKNGKNMCLPCLRIQAVRASKNRRARTK